MKPIYTFKAVPKLPPELEPLRKLAYNLRWAWHHETIELFRRLDGFLWETTEHNPVLMLGTIDQEKLKRAATDESFLAHMNRVLHELDGYLNGSPSWFQKLFPDVKKPFVAYFSAEFGVTECLSIFAGGLGVLAGDHLKSASDLGIPLVGVGLLYQQGYFRQYLNEAGWQQEAYENNDFFNLPVSLQKNYDGTPIKVKVRLPGRSVTIQVWRVNVGRVPLFLLDTNIAENSQEDRDITDQLYGGDREMRIKQEIVLGIGGYRALEALGLEPTVYHMNEGHSVFLALERIRKLMEKENLTFSEAREAAGAGLVFTTHTSVEAGQDYFSPQLMENYFRGYIKAVGLSRNEFLSLGRERPSDDLEPFCMTIMALRLAAHSNGVSRLHGEVTRKMWKGLWPDVPEKEIPIGHVTNGIHFQSWISRDMKELYDRYLSPRWRDEPADHSVWKHVEQIAAEELWRTHERRRERLVSFSRRHLKKQLLQRGASPNELKTAEEILDPEALTIGFARRFAEYKRATLLLQDPTRLAGILNDPERPVQIIFAGKAHPQNHPAKMLIKKIVDLARCEEFRRRLVLLEDYDMTVGRYLVQGADVWLNTPLRPREASGTSGMKATANGVLNLSILDGWWDEAYQPEFGWAIGRRETYKDQKVQDKVEAEALYDLLEREVVPAFYKCNADRLPRQWINRMKSSIQNLCGYFNTHRMLSEYTKMHYFPAAQHYQKLLQDNMKAAKELATWKEHIKKHWSEIRLEPIHNDSINEVKVDDRFTVQIKVYLGSLEPKDVSVELYQGQIDPSGDIEDAAARPMTPQKQEIDGAYIYQTESDCQRSGLHGYTVRVLPKHDNLVSPFIPGYVIWA